MGDKAKLFQTGRSQAVRLPKAYRFDEDEVWIRRDATTGDVILSRRPPDWSRLFALYDSTDVDPDFLGESERAHSDERRDPFDEPDR